MSVLGFGRACGFYSDEDVESDWYKGSIIDPPEGVDYAMMWNELADDEHEYDPGCSKSTKLHSYALRYIHRLITYTLWGRGESKGVVNRVELLCLWCMHKGWVCNLGALFARYLVNIGKKKKGSLFGGTYITQIAKSLNKLDPVDRWTKLHDMVPLDMYTLSKMRIVNRRSDGSYYLVPMPGEHEPEEERQHQEDVPADNQDQPEGDAEMAGLEADIDEAARNLSLEDEVRGLSGRFDAFVGQYNADMVQTRRQLQWMQDSLNMFFHQHNFDVPPPPPSPEE